MEYDESFIENLLNARYCYIVFTLVLKGRSYYSPHFIVQYILGSRETLRTSLTFYNVVNEVVQALVQGSVTLETKIQSLSKMRQETDT